MSHLYIEKVVERVKIFDAKALTEVTYEHATLGWVIINHK